MYSRILFAILALFGSLSSGQRAERMKRLIAGIPAMDEYKAFTCETTLYLPNRPAAHCSGALVDKDGVIGLISCAHCFILPNATVTHDYSRWVDDTVSNDFNVYRPALGSSFYVRCGRGSVAGAPQLQLELQTTQIKLHRNYGPDADSSKDYNALYDIAMVGIPAARIQRSWKWTPWMVHAHFQPPTGRRCTVISYGSTVAGDEKMASVANQGERKVIEWDICRVPSIICLGRPDDSPTSSEFDIQAGDSGAPCVCQRREDSRTRKLCGIVSSVRPGRSATGQPSSGIAAVVPLYHAEVWQFITAAFAAP